MDSMIASGGELTKTLYLSGIKLGGYPADDFIKILSSSAESS
jgi:hypothetical protein